jgi:hypothetical protein
VAALLARRLWTPRRFAVWCALGAWLALCVILGSYLLMSHLVTLPAPAPADPGFQQAIATQRRATERDRWLALHVVLDGCGCSRRVLDHLLVRARPPGIAERIVLVTERPASTAGAAVAIRARGFDLDVVTPEQLVARYRIEAAPLLVVADPRDTVRYVGGYTARKQGADIRDLAVIAAVQAGAPVEPLPTFGCAVGRALRSKLDPLGVRRN